MTEAQKRQLAEVHNHLIDAAEVLVDTDREGMTDAEQVYVAQVQTLIEVTRGVVGKMELTWPVEAAECTGCVQEREATDNPKATCDDCRDNSEAAWEERTLSQNT